MDLFILVLVCLMLVYRQHWSGDVVGIVISLWTGRLGVRMPVGGKDSSLLLNVQSGSGVQPASY
jgi:hypothetical protein